jgi:hypothetical protein
MHVVHGDGRLHQRHAGLAHCRETGALPGQRGLETLDRADGICRQSAGAAPFVQGLVAPGAVVATAQEFLGFAMTPGMSSRRAAQM